MQQPTRWMWTLAAAGLLAGTVARAASFSVTGTLISGENGNPQVIFAPGHPRSVHKEGREADEIAAGKGGVFIVVD